VHVVTDDAVFTLEHFEPSQKFLEVRHESQVVNSDGSGAVVTEVVVSATPQVFE